MVMEKSPIVVTMPADWNKNVKNNSLCMFLKNKLTSKIIGSDKTARISNNGRDRFDSQMFRQGACIRIAIFFGELQHSFQILFDKQIYQN